MYFFSLICFSEILFELFLLVLYDHENLIELINNGFDIVLDNGFSTDFQKWLWGTIREWAESRSFSCRHDDEVHIY